MATYDYAGYDDDQITWPGGTVSNGDAITFTQPADHLIQITDNDTRLEDGTDDRDDEDSNQTAIVYDEFGAVETSGQVQPRDEITLSDGTNNYFMTEVYIASSNSYYYIFQDPAPSMNVEYTVTNVSNPNTTNYSELSAEGVACFTTGTLIATPEGDRTVEALQAGDLVTTLDRRPQPILWIGRRHITWFEMRSHKGLRPFMVRADSFGPGCPVTDTRFSRQHRVLLTARMVSHPKIGPAGALAPVHTLTGVAGINEQCPTAGITYFHILTKHHNLLWSNGIATETLLLTAYSNGLIDRQPDAIVGTPPDFGLGGMAPARPILHNKLARRIAEKIERSHNLRVMALAH
ncbi:hypothetical protein ROLI_014310 [Roseobacter fucihabitans]|uniref:Hedgehog/Intein (Hint) domain-containing protein n=1 Tax=Roseobacter fucihabitans TaxID=1537242 RepID=A0ABZ2BR77_9RHOB|nr:Hint domain-containing protein [Roseobacter litoralis]MBC6968307.1 hypothetical protein [Roseobacter litoralis]